MSSFVRIGNPFQQLIPSSPFTIIQLALVNSSKILEVYIDQRLTWNGS